jgi:hypothetical protein
MYVLLATGPGADSDDTVTPRRSGIADAVQLIICCALHSQGRDCSAPYALAAAFTAAHARVRR